MATTAASSTTSTATGTGTGTGTAIATSGYPDITQYDVDQLPGIIDVAGDIYYTGDEKPIQLGYKTRADMLNAFHINDANSSRKTENLNKERLLRTYLYKGANLSSMRFEGNDRQLLIDVLKQRADDLKASLAINSSSFKQIVPERNYRGLLVLIKDLDNHEYKPGWSASWDKTKESAKELLRIGQNKKYARELVTKPERIFETVLEMLWYLLHPDNVPDDIKRSWYAVVKGMDNLKIRDLITAINSDPDISKEANPLDYISKINLSQFTTKPTIDEAMTEIPGDIKSNKNEILIGRLRKILMLLQTRKYLSDDSISKISNTTADLDASIMSDINKSLISNPMSGGAATNATTGGAVETPLQGLMMPFFDFFKEKYSTVYDKLEELIEGAETHNITYKLPELLLLLHIIRNVNTDNKSKDKHGVYRIDNVNETLGALINYIISSINPLDDSNKELFNKLSEVIPNKYNTSGKNYNLHIGIGTFSSSSFAKLSDDEAINSLINDKELGIAVNTFKTEIDTFFIDDSNKRTLYLCISNDKSGIPYKLNTIDFAAQSINNVNISSTAIKADTSVLITKAAAGNIKLNDVIVYGPDKKDNKTFVLNDGHIILLILCIFKKLMPTN